MGIKTINPSTGQLLKEYPLLTQSEIETAISSSYEDYLQWSQISYKNRAEKMQHIAELLLKNKKDYAKLMALEMGKPISAGIAEVEKCSLVCDYYAKNTETLLQPKSVQTEYQKSYITYEPIGLILTIMPWNFPLWQVFRFAAPNLMAGNGCLLKHAQISTGTALEIEKLFRAADFPKNLFRTLVINSDQATAIITHPKIAAVTLTGSKRAGSEVANAAGKNLKKAVLELGGSDPYIILADADLENAARICLSSRLANSGQVCIAAKRIIAVEAIYDKLLEHLHVKMQNYILDDPLNENTQLGPLAREDLRSTVHDQVQRSIQAGATILLGGQIPAGPGFYYPPTLLVDVKPGMPAFDEEVFGPVVALIKARNIDDAIDLANQTEYGLGAALFTEDLALGEEIVARKIRAGVCAINTFVRSDPRLPFGGIKHSGYGRELALEGLTSFLNIKTIVIN